MPKESALNMQLVKYAKRECFYKQIGEKWDCIPEEIALIHRKAHSRNCTCRIELNRIKFISNHGAPIGSTLITINKIKPVNIK